MTAQIKKSLPLVAFGRIGGFTLIELLLVIAIIGILAAVVAVAINPAQKIKQANDAKAKSDVGQIASAAQSYYTLNGGYPVTGAAGLTALTTASELTAIPAVPNSSYTYTYTAYATAGGTTACTVPTGATPCGAFSVGSTLLAPVTATYVWCFRSATGVAAEAATCAP